MDQQSQWGYSLEQIDCPQPPSTPAWVNRLLGEGDARSVSKAIDDRRLTIDAGAMKLSSLHQQHLNRQSLADLSCRSSECGEYSLLKVRVPQAISFDALTLQKRTAHAYQLIADQLHRQARPPQHPVRFWNFIPQIGVSPQSPRGDGLDRYMVFNAGRFAAFSDWYGGRLADAFARMTATASAVGHFGGDLIIYCLACNTPGLGIENPRQLPSYSYSSRYGPLPPAFTRATVLPDASGEAGRILIGGTASICGERSRHFGDLQRQMRETLENLAAVIRAGCQRLDPHGLNGNGDIRDWLKLCRSLRVYHTQIQQRGFLGRTIAHHFPQSLEIEWVHAELCRRELLVEIEGVAELMNVATPAVIRTRRFQHEAQPLAQG